MFDFLDSDWFNITLEIVFLLLISWDIKRYFETKKKEYIINIVLTIGFAIWALYPYYNSYIEWDEVQKQSLLSHCNKEKNATLCSCVDDAIFKNYTHDEYIKLDKNSTEFQEFLKETKKDCSDDGWF
jgi:hypothetical protein